MANPSPVPWEYSFNFSKRSNTFSLLSGGLYGVTIGKVFIGESMFSRVPSASKIALIFLARYLQEHGGKMIDCQLETPHLKSMGGRYISYEEYMKIMNEE
jgi:leucyl/phenylalanyl-tRNA--protein transferase